MAGLILRAKRNSREISLGEIWSRMCQAQRGLRPIDPEELAEDLFIQIQSTGRRIAVGKYESLIDALSISGVEIPSSCQSGLCGTCKTRYLSGQVEHGDCILSDAEHEEHFTPCVSHIRSGAVILDL